MYGHEKRQRLFRKSFKKLNFEKKNFNCWRNRIFRSLLALKCLRNDFQVVSLSRNKPKKERFLKKVKYLYADISNKKQLKYKLNLKI